LRRSQNKTPTPRFGSLEDLAAALDPGIIVFMGIIAGDFGYLKSGCPFIKDSAVQHGKSRKHRRFLSFFASVC
jgi:hypothetical protein